jgi:hypothetical protein
MFGGECSEGNFREGNFRRGIFGGEFSEGNFQRGIFGGESSPGEKFVDSSPDRRHEKLPKVKLKHPD